MQLKPGGRMIIPIGQPFKRGQVQFVLPKDAEGKIHSRRGYRVFFIPMTGAIAKSQPVRPETVSDHPAADKPITDVEKPPSISLPADKPAADKGGGGEAGVE